MQPEVVKLLRDILDSGESIQQYTAGASFGEYEQSRMLRMAVEREMMIIGEALNVALQKDPTLADIITDARKIVGFRHILVHVYSLIDNERVWETITRDIPLLLAEVRALLPPAP